MIPAKIPENENRRLVDLYRTGLLDTPHEEEFDEIVKLASSICNMPVSLISLVDSNRQWFKAKVGLDMTETSREISFCSHAILQDQLFEVSDAQQDSRFYDNPLVVADPAIRFYAGMPLVTSNGCRLGTLCVIDKHPGRLTEQQRFGLRVLANNVIKIAELRIKNKELYYHTENQKRIISILAHDVRNPLASIKNIIELRQTDVLDTREAAEMMEKVNEQLDSTIEMVENIVNWGQTQLKFGALKLEDIDIHRLVERIFNSESLKSIAKHNKLVNLVPPGAVVHSDERALEFILRNLVSNANKFTENGNISITMAPSGIKSILQVSDTGLGMTNEKAAELMSDMPQTSTLGTGKEKGSGLGLMLIKEFISRMDGNISVESSPGAGTTFTITI